jgi:ATP-dependent helicase/nuclease subunit A
MMSNESVSALAVDERARREALDPQRSVMLQAPAGSGKTTVLVCRFLILLAHASAPEEVLAITFTRKAAAEMRARVLRALTCAAAGEGSDKPEFVPAVAALQRSRERGWELLAQPSQLRIQTIDALNFTLAAQLPVAARAGADLQLTQPATALYRRAARDTLLAALAQPESATALELLLVRLDNRWEKLEELLSQMLAERAHWLPRVLSATDPELDRQVAASVQNVVREALATVAAALGEALQQQTSALIGQLLQEAAAGNPPAGWSAWRLFGTAPLGAEPADLPRWRELAGLALTQDNEWRRRLDKRQGIGPTQKTLKTRALEWLDALRQRPQLKPLLAELRLLPEPELLDEDAPALRALSGLLRSAAAQLHLVFAATGRVDYAYVAGAARQALLTDGEPTDLALRFGAAIRHILIDEFQDTSIEQVQLLRALTVGWEQGDGRTLFAVGDPMQSIYQFREAEVGLFLQVRDYGLGALRLDRLELRRNFRSAPELIDWVNTQFAALFPAADDARLAAVRHLAALPVHDAMPGKFAVHPLADAQPTSEARRIVQIVREARAAQQECTIAVLVPGRRHAGPIRLALVAAGFPVRGVDLEPLASRPLVGDLVALARALQHPADRPAWLALLRAPWCGLTVAEMQRLAETDALLWHAISEPQRLADFDPAARSGVERLRAALAPAIDGVERHEPLWLRTDRCWLRLGGPALAADDADLDDARALLEALAQAPQSEQLAAGEIDSLAAGLHAAAGADTHAVQMLTMHGAKGLEWDVVIVPALGRRGAADREPLLHRLELPRADGGSDLLLAPINPTGQPHIGSLGAYIRYLRAQRQEIERVRLLYVTATRARRELHWLGHAPVDAKGQLAPSRGTLLAALWPVLGAHFPTPEPAAAAEPRPAISLPALGHWPVPWPVGPTPTQAPAERVTLSLREPEATPEYSWVGLAARAVGTVVHAELRRLAQTDELPGAASGRDYQRWLQQLGVEMGEQAAAQTQVHAALERTLNDERGRWLLSAAHRESQCELPLTGLYQGRVVNAIIDRTFVDASGARWVIDYKTSSHEGGSLAEFLKQEAERYRPQLARYATLAAALGPEPVRAALYFPLLGELCELTV